MRRKKKLLIDQSNKYKGILCPWIFHVVIVKDKLSRRKQIVKKGRYKCFIAET